MFRSIRWRRVDQSEATCRSRGYDAAMVSIKGVTSYPGPTPRYIRTTSTKPRQVGLFAPLASVGTVGREQDVCGDEIRHVFRSLTLRDNRTSTLGIIQHFRNSKSHSAARGTQHAFASANSDGGKRRPTAVKQRSTSSFPLPSVLSSSPAVGGRTGIEIAQQSARDITRFVDIATWWLSLASHASLRCSLAKDTFPHHRRQSDHSSGGHRTSN